VEVVLKAPMSRPNVFGLPVIANGADQSGDGAFKAGIENGSVFVADGIFVGAVGIDAQAPEFFVGALGQAPLLHYNPSLFVFTSCPVAFSAFFCFLAF